MSDKGVADLFRRASAAFTALDHTRYIKTTSLTSCLHSSTHLARASRTLDFVPQSSWSVWHTLSLETAVQSGALINLELLGLSNTLTEDADVNGALLTTLLQSIASHCSSVLTLFLHNNNLGLPGLCSVAENIPLRLNHINLTGTHFTTSFHSESQYTLTCEMLKITPNYLTMIDLTHSNFSGTTGTLLLAKILQAFQSLKGLDCSDCSLTSSDIIMLIHHLKSNNVICKNINALDLRDNSIDDDGVIALTECLPELFLSLKVIGAGNHCDIDLCGNPVSEELIHMCNKHLEVKYTH